MSTTRKTLVKIQKFQAFEQLEPFKQPTVWKNLSQEDRHLLAELLVMQGTHQLARGDRKALESFEIASEIASDSADIFYEQAVALSFYRENKRCLTLAYQALMRIIQLDASQFRFWYLKAQVLMDMGLLDSESTYFYEAHKSYEKAFTLFNETSGNSNSAAQKPSMQELYWKWGLSLAALGQASGEPCDFHQSLEKYRLAYENGCRSSKFLNDFGQTFIFLSKFLEKPIYLYEALKLFDEVIEQDSQDFKGWYNHACCIQNLMEFITNDELIEQGEKSFIKAAEIDSQNGQLWLKWGEFETFIGKFKQDIQMLGSSLDKFAEAYRLEPGDPQILNSWASSLLFIGVQEERLDLIQMAKLKISESLEIQPEDSDAWYLYGSCLNELGRYFNDEEYYHQAIEKFEYGLSLKQSNPLLWYGYGASHLALGELTEMPALFEKAAQYFSRVIEYKREGFGQFWNDWGVALLKFAEFTQQPSFVEMAIEKFERALKPIQDIENQDIDLYSSLEWVYNYGAAFNLLGELVGESSHFEKAIEILTQVVQLDSEYLQARYSLATAFAHLAETSCDVELYYKAIEQFQNLLDKNPEDEEAHLDFGMALTDLGLLLKDAYRSEQAQALYKRAEHHILQATLLGNTQSYYHLAGLYSIMGRFDNAMHYLERAQMLDILPDIEDLLHDEWLENLQQVSAFRQFINQLSTQQWEGG